MGIFFNAPLTGLVCDLSSYRVSTFHTLPPVPPEATISLSHFLHVSCHCVTEHGGKWGRISTRQYRKHSTQSLDTVRLRAQSAGCVYGVSCVRYALWFGGIFALQNAGAPTLHPASPPEPCGFQTASTTEDVHS